MQKNNVRHFYNYLSNTKQVFSIDTLMLWINIETIPKVYIVFQQRLFIKKSYLHDIDQSSAKNNDTAN